MKPFLFFFAYVPLWNIPPVNILLYSRAPKCVPCPICGICCGYSPGLLWPGGSNKTLVSRRRNGSISDRLQRMCVCWKCGNGNQGGRIQGPAEHTFLFLGLPLSSMNISRLELSVFEMAIRTVQYKRVPRTTNQLSWQLFLNKI